MATINYKDPATEQWVEIPTGVTVDSTLSSTSENPVQNKVVNSALNEKYLAVNPICCANGWSAKSCLMASYAFT